MKPDDPRHGTNRGYVVGCREACCTAAHTKYMKLYRLGRQPQLVDPLGTMRRFQALQAIGWSSAEIGRQCGRSPEWARLMVRNAKVTSTNAALIADAYERMCMVVPVGPMHSRSRRYFRARGYLPPLAWDNIDNPDEQPRGWRYEGSTRAEQLADLDEQGVGIEVACKELDISRRSLERWCERHDLRDIYERMVLRDNAHGGWQNQHGKAVAS